MGRPRTSHHGLPPRLHKKGNSYYYVASGSKRVWIPLGSDLRRARAQWAVYENQCTSNTVAQLLEQYYALQDLKPSSLKQYRAYCKALTAEFGAIGCDQLQTHRVAQWRDKNRHRKPFINGCLSVLRNAYVLAREWGWCDHDPSPKGFDRTRRARLLTHDEFRAIRSHAPVWLQDAMDLAYITGLRQSDLVGLKWSSIDSALAVRQVKTSNRQEYLLNEALLAVLARCKSRRVVGLYVVSNERGRPIRTQRLQEYFADARDAAGVVDAGFHDIRSLAATDAKKQGLDYQALLGHSSARQSEAYIRSFEAMLATPLKEIL